MSKRLFDLAETIAPLQPSANGGAAYDRFQDDPDCLALAVVDADGRPIGIVERNAFFLKMAAEYGRALYARRPIAQMMNDRPLRADGEVLIMDFCRAMLAERPSELLQGFIVTQDGRYLGVGTALSLLKAGSAADKAHAEEMTLVAESLNRAKQEAQAALAARSQFLAVMSHEIRTPLNGVLALAELLHRKLNQEELRPYLGAIIKSGETLLRLLTDALDLSRADAGALQLIEDSFPVAPLLEDLQALWEPGATQKGIALRLVYDGPPGQWVLGDVIRIRQIFNNLIGNAIKFTDQGEVNVRLNAVRDGGFVRLEGVVADTGVGIPDDRLGSVFTAFDQTPEGLARGGAGLGLSVCRELVQRMNGSIAADRGPAGGSVFRFEVTLYDTPEPSITASDASFGDMPALPMLNILIADDNATNRLVAQTLCEHLGCTCTAVENGELAVAAVKAGRFDLVLMDVKMPVMDGVAATRAIRLLPAPLCEIPVLALTANADPWDAAQYLTEGVDAVVEKPIKVGRLAEAIMAALKFGRRRAA